MRKRKLLRGFALLLAVITVGTLIPDASITYAETGGTVAAAEDQGDSLDTGIFGKGQNSGMKADHKAGETETTEAETTEAETTEAETTEAETTEAESTEANRGADQTKDSESDVTLPDETSDSEGNKGNGNISKDAETEGSKAKEQKDNKTTENPSAAVTDDTAKKKVFKSAEKSEDGEKEPREATELNGTEQADTEERSTIAIPQNLSWNEKTKVLTWDAVENAEGYKIQIQITDALGNTKIEDETVTTNKFEYKKDLILESTYKFLVAANIGTESSEWAESELYEVSAEKFPAVRNPHWTGNGYAEWEDDLSGEQKELIKGVEIEIYKENVYKQPWHVNGGYLTITTLNGIMDEHGAGTYTFRIRWMLKDGSEAEWSEFSEAYIREPLDKKAPVPADYHWTKEGSIEWKPIDRADVPGYSGDFIYYYLRLYEEGQEEPFDFYGAIGSQLVSHIKYLKAGKTYRFDIRTGGDGVTYDGSDYSKLSEPFTMTVSKDTAKGKINSLLDVGNDERLVQEVDRIEITDEERKEMASGLQADSDMAANFMKLENAYRQVSGSEFLIQSENGIVNKNQVTVAGGVLNGASKIDFVPAKKADIALDQYFKKLTMDISLDKNDLKFPVLITMPVPSGMNAGTVKIYHYHNGGSKEEIKPAVVTENGVKKLRFAVSEFSIFTFVDTSNTASSGFSGGSITSYSRSRSSGNTLSPAQYDIPGNASLMVGTWVKDEKGWWLKKANKTYPQNQWAKINNAIYRFDKEGYMVEGWLNLYQKWYYLKPESGSMATGWIQDKDNWYYLNPDGAMAMGWIQDKDKWYYLNPDGAMTTGWKEIDGKWYYLGSDGAMYVDTTTPDNHQVDKDGVRIK